MTGASISLLVILAFLLVATGIALLLLVSGRGVFRGAGIVITLVVGTTVLGFSEAPRADADSCLSTAPAVAAAVGTTTTTTADQSITGAIPPVVTSPGEALPDSSLVVAFPAIGLLIMSGYLVMHRRRNQADTR
ncbi:MAG: hypothetical protein ACLPYY_01450 [Acidimicrobiales bacterium]